MPKRGGIGYPVVDPVPADSKTEFKNFRTGFEIFGPGLTEIGTESTKLDWVPSPAQRYF